MDRLVIFTLKQPVLILLPPGNYWSACAIWWLPLTLPHHPAVPARRAAWRMRRRRCASCDSRCRSIKRRCGCAVNQRSGKYVSTPAISPDPAAGRSLSTSVKNGNKSTCCNRALCNTVYNADAVAPARCLPKADHLAAAEFLLTWAERNAGHREQLAAEFDRRGVLHDLPTSMRIAGWAYQQTFEVGGLAWVKKEEMVPLGPDWRAALATV